MSLPLKTNVSSSTSNAPSARNFVRRVYHSSVAVGDFVYIDGGEVSQLGKGDGDLIGRIADTTLSIDMSKSWTNDTVSLKSINKGDAPILNAQTLWPSTDNKTFFTFSGGQSWWAPDIDPPEVACWKFKADGHGAGAWSVLKPSSGSVFEGLTRPDGGVGAAVDNTGFVLKSSESTRSSPETTYLKESVPLPGIVSFNITSGAWSNDTLPDYVEKSVGGLQGIISDVPVFGPDGLLIMSGFTENTNNMPPLDNITIYDPSNKSWHTQTATGQIPSGRRNACTVGVPGDNGTFEVFMYGGHNLPTLVGNITLAQYKANVALDEIYILSLPGFRWFKADYEAQQTRIKHQCHRVGQSQMLSVGGQDPTDVYRNATSRDPFSQGLGIFDLTNLKWSDSYDANAEPYKTPAVVKSWYKTNGASTKNWDDPAVQKLFTGVSTITPGESSGSASTPASSTKSHSTSAGAIAGGVIGGLVALCLVLGLILWWLRRKRARRGADGSSPPTYPESIYEAEGEHPGRLHSELPAKGGPFGGPFSPELPVKEKSFPSELPNTYETPEMEGAPVRREMDGRGGS